MDSWKHENRPSLGCEILIESLLLDGTASWVRVVNGSNKYVTETSETISFKNVEHTVAGKLVAKAKPRPKLVVTLSPISIPLREKKIDGNQRSYRVDRRNKLLNMTRLPWKTIHTSQQNLKDWVLRLNQDGAQTTTKSTT